MKRGMLHMDANNARNLSDVLRQMSAAIDGIVAAAPVGTDTRRLAALSKRGHDLGNMLSIEFWRLLDGSEATWAIEEEATVE